MCHCQLKGTTQWFVDSDKYDQWKVTGSLLWIHGKRMSILTMALVFLCIWHTGTRQRAQGRVSYGSSLLQNVVPRNPLFSSSSAVINNVMTLCKARTASLAYFYFDFRDVDKQSLRNLLQSLLSQLSTHSDTFFDILSGLYVTHDEGARQPFDSDLTQCLKEMLTAPNQGPIYLIMDALDKCPDTSDVSSARRQVLDFVRDLVCLRLPDLRICITSRPEVDISEALKPLAPQTICLQDELGQSEDIVNYVRYVVHSGISISMKRWREEDKEYVIETLSKRADGMYECKKYVASTLVDGVLTGSDGCSANWTCCKVASHRQSDLTFEICLNL